MITKLSFLNRSEYLTWKNSEIVAAWWSMHHSKYQEGLYTTDLLRWGPLEKLSIWPYNKSLIDQACSAKMAWYWTRLFFHFIELNLVSVDKNAKKNYYLDLALMARCLCVVQRSSRGRQKTVSFIDKETK